MRFEDLIRDHGGKPDVNATTLEQQIDHERIARRAFEIYESRGRVEGHADDDWFQSASEYAARDNEPRAADHYGNSDSFGERVRRARR